MLNKSSSFFSNFPTPFLALYLLLCVIPIFGQRVEAEKMKLKNYKVDRNETATFIKLSGSNGVAEFKFTFPSGRYDIDARFLSEKIGQNTYAIYLNGVQIISWLGKNRDDQWHLLSDQKWHAPKNIPINRGDLIRIETLSGTESLAILDYIEFTESDKVISSTKQNIVSVTPEEYTRAIRNPLMGFRGKFDPSHEYSTLVKDYIAWNEIENTADDSVYKIMDVCDNRWKGCEANNIKVIPRVYLEYPGRPLAWPSDMTAGDYTSNQFKHRIVALIKKIGKAWDNDSRVAYVEIGLIGQWGEMEFPDTSDSIKEAISAAFAASFQNKLVMIRWPNTYNDDIYNFGYYWDSWGHYDQRYYGFNLNNLGSRWKTSVIGGEAAYDWGNSFIQPGKSPTATVSEKIHRDFIIDQIRTYHANHMGWISDYDQKNEAAKTGAAIVQKAMGYNFVITEFHYPRKIENRNNFAISFKVKNTGSSPFYYNWPVELSLLDPKSKLPVWKTTLTNVDIRNWLPGDKWDSKSKSYLIEAEHYLINQSIAINEVPTGEYIIALSILDPAGNRPSARFAIKNYYNGGRHPMGKIGVSQDVTSYEISDFDDIQSDRSLSYDSEKK